MADESVGNWIKVARDNFDFDHLTVVAEGLLGADAIFIYDAPTKGGTQRYALYVGSDQKGRERLSAVSSSSPLELMVMNSFIAAQTAPDEFKPLPNINLRYQYPIPLGGKLDSGAHPVFFEFDGLPMDFPLDDEKAKAPTPMLEFLRDANLAYRRDKNEIYAGNFTPKSQEKVREWLASIETQKREKLKQEQAKPKAPKPPAAPSPAEIKASAATEALVAPHVKFVLNADPLFLVFQAPGPGSAWKPANLVYSYIVRLNGAFKIANFGYSNTLDDFLQDPALFDKSVLKPARQKPGAAKASVAPVAAKPATAKH
jgi:hypothetical protein